MYRFLKHLIVAACVALILFGGTASINAAPPGSVEGHLKIFSLKVELAGETRRRSNPALCWNYAEYPLIILSQDGKKSRV
jgi:hypothetical protein